MKLLPSEVEMCPICHRWVRLRADGTLAKHRLAQGATHDRCHGSWRVADNTKAPLEEQ